MNPGDIIKNTIACRIYVNTHRSDTRTVLDLDEVNKIALVLGRLTIKPARPDQLPTHWLFIIIIDNGIGWTHASCWETIT